MFSGSIVRVVGSNRIHNDMVPSVKRKRVLIFSRYNTEKLGMFSFEELNLPVLMIRRCAAFPFNSVLPSNYRKL